MARLDLISGGVFYGYTRYSKDLQVTVSARRGSQSLDASLITHANQFLRELGVEIYTVGRPLVGP